MLPIAKRSSNLQKVLKQKSQSLSMIQIYTPLHSNAKPALNLPIVPAHLSTLVIF